MTPLQVRAPGKLMILGEYAVVDGAPAVVAAVDRGVCCDIRPGPFAITTPGDDRFVRDALQGAPAAHYQFSDWNPVELPSKPGLGGSAAAVVAAVQARAAMEGSPLGPESLHRKAAGIHHRIQGSGSGADVAASSWGGVIRFEGGDARPLAPLNPVVVWSGSSAKTGPRVEQYLSWAGRDRFVHRSRDLVDRFVDDPVDALRAATELLDAMTRAAGISWWTQGLREIHDMAETCGGTAKPSGAGGGDVAVGLFPDPDARERFVAGCNRAGLPVIPVRLAAGAHITR